MNNSYGNSEHGIINIGMEWGLHVRLREGFTDELRQI